jgi:hypothetical protein
MTNAGSLQPTIKLNRMYTGYAEDGIDTIVFQYLYQYFPASGHYESPEFISAKSEASAVN